MQDCLGESRAAVGFAIACCIFKRQAVRVAGPVSRSVSLAFCDPRLGVSLVATPLRLSRPCSRQKFGDLPEFPGPVSRNPCRCRFLFEWMVGLDGAHLMSGFEDGRVGEC